MNSRRRLDAELLRRGFASSRELAQGLIHQRRVLVDGVIAEKPARLVGIGQALTVLGEPPRYVSRGGEKLHAAIEQFGIDCRGQRVLDAGASTGGFTDCCLQHGAAEVVAVDVGYGQLHEKLRADPRVVVRERTNVRKLASGDLGAPFALVVADLSFISLSLVLDGLLAVAAEPCDFVFLVKPQFEAGREAVSAGRGVIRDPQIRADVLVGVADSLVDRGGLVLDAMVSPLRGADGNVEFLIHARVGQMAQQKPDSWSSDQLSILALSTEP